MVFLFSLLLLLPDYLGRMSARLRVILQGREIIKAR